MILEKNHAVIETAEEATVFNNGVVDDFLTYIRSNDYPPPTISRYRVLKAIAPNIENDAIFWWFKDSLGTERPRYSFPSNTCSTCYMSTPWEKPRAVKANALTIGKTCGELRELIAWVREE